MGKSTTYLEKLTQETLRPILGALSLFRQEFVVSMNIPDAPWKVLGKPYDELGEEEIMALMDIYHVDGETTPCPMCEWISRLELGKHRKEKEMEEVSMVHPGEKTIIINP